MTFEIVTLGCKLNFCESAAIEKQLIDQGFTPSENGQADICVVNSCAVTAAAVSKTRHALSKLRRENPNAVTVLCGCFPQSFPEEAGLNADADIVVGNSDKSRTGQLVAEYLKHGTKTVKVNPITREFDENASVPDEDRTRAFIKIQDGCDRFCTYCIIPTARGRTRSLAPEKITEQAVRCVRNGHKEIVLTGINLSCYGQELGLSLADGAAAAARSGVERIRLSSLEPEMLTDEEIAKLKTVKGLCPHFHLSLQSGSDTVLKRMNRRYDTETYRSVAEKLRKTFPDCSLTTDIIVGFPGETEEEFGQTMDFISEIKFAKIHVFPYSIRRGTVAAEMVQTDPVARAKRAEILNEAAKRLETEFLSSQKNTVQTVLVEKPQSKEYSFGFTENYTPVRIYGKPIERHTLTKVIISGFGRGFCEGKLL